MFDESNLANACSIRVRLESSLNTDSVFDMSSTSNRARGLLGSRSIISNSNRAQQTSCSIRDRFEDSKSQLWEDRSNSSTKIWKYSEIQCMWPFQNGPPRLKRCSVITFIEFRSEVSIHYVDIIIKARGVPFRVCLFFCQSKIV